MAGYSNTPLPKKLGFKEQQRAAVIRPPDGFEQTLGELPRGVTLQGGLGTAKSQPLDLIICFITRRSQLERELPAMRKRMALAGSLWVAWPKRASGVKTDVTEDVIREISLPTGLVDNKVCAIDETWSGLRLVIRLENRK